MCRLHGEDSTMYLHVLHVEISMYVHPLLLGAHETAHRSQEKAEEYICSCVHIKTNERNLS